MTGQNDLDAKEFCLNLLQSETEEELVYTLISTFVPTCP